MSRWGRRLLRDGSVWLRLFFREPGKFIREIRCAPVLVEWGGGRLNVCGRLGLFHLGLRGCFVGGPDRLYAAIGAESAGGLD